MSGQKPSETACNGEYENCRESQGRARGTCHLGDTKEKGHTEVWPSPFRKFLTLATTTSDRSDSDQAGADEGNGAGFRNFTRQAVGIGVANGAAIAFRT